MQTWFLSCKTSLYVIVFLRLGIVQGQYLTLFYVQGHFPTRLPLFRCLCYNFLVLQFMETGPPQNKSRLYGEYEYIQALSLQITDNYTNLHTLQILQCMLMKLSFQFRACDSAQNGVHGKQVKRSHLLVRGDKSFKLQQILYKNALILG